MNKTYFYLKLEIVFFLTIIAYIFKIFNYNIIKKPDKYSDLNQKNKLFDINNKFAIISDSPCKRCGLLSFYMQYIGCISRFLNSGYIPVIDLESFPNIFNGFNASSINENPWEDYFEQPFGYTLKNVKKFSKNISYFKCTKYFDYPIHYIYSIKETNLMIKKLFKGSKNILGILARGTDYFACKPKNHPIPPNIEIMINDINEMDKKYYYDWFFLSTEDDLIRTRLIQKLGYKLKYLKSNINIKYNFKKKQWLYKNPNIYKNYQYHKIYLINILILSKCIDIISARTGGAIVLYIISNGFRNDKIYYLGNY